MTSAPRTTTSGGHALKHADLSQPPMNIPNTLGVPFKTELVLVRSPQKTIKINWWHLPDDDRPPHNHPWDFTSEILHGGYTEVRYTLDDGAEEWRSETLVHKAGEVFTVSRDEYHRVIAVEPGTVTRITCGQAATGNEWGYLDLETGDHVTVEKDPKFVARLWACNPWMKN